MPLTKPPAWSWTAAGSAAPAIAAKMKMGAPFDEGAGNPRELVSGEFFQMLVGDTWTTKNSLTGVTFLDYTDGIAPGSDTTGRPLTSASFALKVPCALWALISVPTVQADPDWGSVLLFNFSSPGGGQFSMTFIPNTSGTSPGMYNSWSKDAASTNYRFLGGGGASFPPGALVSVVTVFTPTSGSNSAYIDGVLATGLDQAANAGTVNAGDAIENPASPFNLGYAYAQEHTSADPGTFVPGMDRWVTHACAAYESLTPSELAAMVADPFAPMTQGVVAGNVGSPAGRRRFHRHMAALFS